MLEQDERILGSYESIIFQVMGFMVYDLGLWRFFVIFLICVVIDCDPHGDITRLHSVN